jgi:DNA-binding MarR family transcriptional regulator
MHDTHKYDALFLALLDLVSSLNSPRQDDVLLQEAGITIDRALFPLLVRIGAAGSLNISGLAEQVGRDHSTLSRQTAKLESLGFVRRRTGKLDQRSKDIVLTAEGRRLVQTLTNARSRLLDKLLADWTSADVQTLARLNRKLADAMKSGVETLRAETIR